MYGCVLWVFVCVCVSVWCVVCVRLVCVSVCLDVCVRVCVRVCAVCFRACVRVHLECWFFFDCGCIGDCCRGKKGLSLLCLLSLAPLRIRTDNCNVAIEFVDFFFIVLIVDSVHQRAVCCWLYSYTSVGAITIRPRRD